MKSTHLIALGLAGYAVGAVGSALTIGVVLKRKYRGRGIVPERVPRPKSIMRGRLDVDTLPGGPA